MGGTDGEPHRSEVEKAERWAIMEWILVGRRVWVVLGAILALALLSAGLVLYADGVSHLSRKELGVFLRRDEEERVPRSMTGPLFGRLHEPGNR